MKIKFLPQNIEVEGTPDKSLLQIATENHLEIRSICKGVPSCAECRVRITEGDNNVLPPNKAELSLIGTNYFIDGRRLSCQVHCFGDVTVDLTEQVERQENQTKKIRGFRSNKQVESKAVNDMMLLNEEEVKEHHHHQHNQQPQVEGTLEKTEAQAAEPREQRPQRQQNQNNQQRENKGQQRARGGDEQRHQNQQKQQHNKQQNQNQNKGGGQQAQGQNKSQHQNKPQHQHNKQQQQQRGPQQNQQPGNQPQQQKGPKPQK